MPIAATYVGSRITRTECPGPTARYRIFTGPKILKNKKQTKTKRHGSEMTNDVIVPTNKPRDRNITDPLSWT